MKEKKNDKWLLILFIFLYAMFIFIPTFSIFYDVFLKKYFEPLDKASDKLRINFFDLEYKIPEDYVIDLYKENSNFTYVLQNDKHDCRIEIYSTDDLFWISLREGVCKVEDDYYYDEKVINGTMWCYDSEKLFGNQKEYFYLNTGKRYYLIKLFNYKNDDNRCSFDFENFVGTLKVKS